ARNGATGLSPHRAGGTILGGSPAPSGRRQRHPQPRESAMRTCWLGGLSLLALCAWAGAGPADVTVRGPFGRNLVAVAPPPAGPGGGARAPGVQVEVQHPPPPLPVLPQQPPGIIVPPPPGVIVTPPPVVVLPARPLTHQEFAAVFKPLPGTYEVVLI